MSEVEPNSFDDRRGIFYLNLSKIPHELFMRKKHNSLIIQFLSSMSTNHPGFNGKYQQMNFESRGCY